MFPSCKEARSWSHGGAGVVNTVNRKETSTIKSTTHICLSELPVVGKRTREGKTLRMDRVKIVLCIIVARNGKIGRQI